MTDEMRAAESLVRQLAPSGLEVPIPEPFALDESTWFLTAVDKALIEFTRCPDTCARGQRAHGTGRDHFETTDGEAQHLFEQINGRPLALHRDYLPCLASYARAVLDFGYDPDRATLLRRHQTGRRLASRFTNAPARTDVAFVEPDGSVQLQIKSIGDRQRTRRLATALDASGARSRLAIEVERELDDVLAAEPQFLWLVGPNSIEPANHVFRLTRSGHDIRFKRVDAVPVPA